MSQNQPICNVWESSYFFFEALTTHLPHLFGNLNVRLNYIQEGQKYSRLSLNGHLYIMDTSVKRTPRVGPAFAYSLYLMLYKMDISLS